MQDVFLQVLDFIGPEGYYARTSKELSIMTQLEKKHLVHKKPGTKKVFIKYPKTLKQEIFDRSSFKELLKKSFFETKSIMQPFVPINDIRSAFQTKGLSKELFDSYLIELYDNNELELEKSFTANEGINSGLNYKNRKFFSYIVNIE